MHHDTLIVTFLIPNNRLFASACYARCYWYSYLLLISILVVSHLQTSFLAGYNSDGINSGYWHTTQLIQYHLIVLYWLYVDVYCYQLLSIKILLVVTN